MSNSPTMRLFYVHGYGFCLSVGGKKYPLNLDGDGALTTDKYRLLDAFNGMADRLDQQTEDGKSDE